MLGLVTPATGWAADTWTFEPRTDQFGSDALLDLRFLNEKVAGEKGWMYAKDGKLYIPGRKEPFRGWTAGLRPYGFDYSTSNLQYTARTYAKLGINQVREMSDANCSILPKRGTDITRIDAEGLGQLHRLVAVMKAEGIYTTYHVWPHALPKPQTDAEKAAAAAVLAKSQPDAYQAKLAKWMYRNMAANLTHTLDEPTAGYLETVAWEEYQMVHQRLKETR